MKPRTVLILVALTAALGLFVWFFERDLPSSDERAEQAGRVFPSGVADVEAIEIVAGEERVLLEREVAAEEGEEASSSTWRLSRPVEARADAGRVDSFLQVVTGLERKRTLEGIGLEDVGLVDARASITLTGPGLTHSLRIGADVPASAAVVVMVDDRDVVVTADEIWAATAVSVEEWRSRDIVPFSAAEIERVEVRGAANPLVLERRGGRLLLREPVADDADEDRARELIREIAGLSVSTFLDEIDDDSSLEADGSRVDLELTIAGQDDPWKVHLAVAEQGAQDVVGESEGQAFRATTSLFELLAAEVTAWQSKSWSASEVFDVEGVEVEFDGESMQLVRSGADWIRDGEAIPYGVVSDLLYAIVDLRGGRLDAAPEDVQSPAVEIRLTTKDGKERLSLLPSASGEFHAVRAGRAFSPVIATAGVEDLMDKVDAARSADPLPAADSGNGL